MKHMLLNLVVLITVFSCTNKAQNREFIALHNGQDWEGWYLKLRNGNDSLAQKVYAIENGEIHIFNDAFPDSIDLFTDENGTHGLFYTHKEYSRFMIRFEYKWGSKIANNFDKYQYDAGFYYHVVDDKIWPKGIEYQIRYDHSKDINHTGDFWASGTLFQWYTTQDSTSFLPPKLGGIQPPKRRGEHLALTAAKHNALNGMWNKCEVIVMADKYTIHKLNGDMVNMATDLSVSKGKIGFQSETAEIHYRNIEIKEFEEDIPIEKFLSLK